MHNHVGNLARAADPKGRFRGTSVTISGSGMDWHDMESYFRPGGIGRYSFVGDNEIVFNKPGRQYDAVIMMDCSQCHPSAAEERVSRIRKKTERDRREARSAAHLLHVVGLQGQARDDRAAGRAIHVGREQQRRAGHTRLTRICQGDSEKTGSGALPAGQTAPQPCRNVSGGVYDLRGDHREIARRQHLPGGSRSQDRELPATDGLGNGAGIFGKAESVLVHGLPRRTASTWASR